MSANLLRACPTPASLEISLRLLSYFALDSILLENIFQFYGSIGAHFLIDLYVIWHYMSGSVGNTHFCRNSC